MNADEWNVCHETMSIYLHSISPQFVMGTRVDFVQWMHSVARRRIKNGKTEIVRRKFENRRTYNEGYNATEDGMVWQTLDSGVHF